MLPQILTFGSTCVASTALSPISANIPTEHLSIWLHRYPASWLKARLLVLPELAKTFSVLFVCFLYRTLVHVWIHVFQLHGLNCTYLSNDGGFSWQEVCIIIDRCGLVIWVCWQLSFP